MQDGLSSLFLPRASVYAELDNPSPASQSTYSLAPSSFPEAEHDQDEHSSRAHGQSVDPFGARSALSASGPPRLSLAPQAAQSLGSSPFHDEAPESIDLHPPSGEVTPTSQPSPTTSRRGAGGGGGGALSASGSTAIGASALGTRSLMGLLGGTRYEPGGFEGLGGTSLREADEDEPSQARHPDGAMSLEESSALAASLPPPPSALSTSSAHSSEDEDAPPDFTRPLTSSASRNTSSTRSPTSSRARRDRDRSRPGRVSLGGGPIGGLLGGERGRRFGMGAKERALWRWVNVEDLDRFVGEVYGYYVGQGIWAIGLARVLNLLTVGWVIVFSTFLLGCVDYSRIYTSHNLAQVVVPQCVHRFSGLSLLLVIAFGAFYLSRLVEFGLGVRKLWEMHEFYAELLEIPENDIQTIAWHAIVERLAALRAAHPSSLALTRGQPQPRLDAHDVASRLMREENYLVALFNKDILDLSLPVPRPLQPLLGARWGGGRLTRVMEWNLEVCLLRLWFGRDGQVREAFTSSRNKDELVAVLRRRFVLMGLINAALMPFILPYLLMHAFFRYFEEYHKNPSSIGSRAFTPLAKWHFREFNELPHLFAQRLARAHPLADKYVNQFPKAKTALLSRFVAFLAGSFCAVLVLFSLVDPDAFLHFEITPGRTVVFWIGIWGAILGVARGMVPDEGERIDARECMERIVEQTHYLPEEWRGKLHSADVHAQFGQLFQMKVALFVQEMLSVVTTPFVLWFSLPECAPAIVDFVREFTVHVDGLGWVCSFSVFDFKRHGDVRFGAPVKAEVGDRFKSTEGKMEMSFLGFAHDNPNWVPHNQAQSLFLSRMTELAPPPLQHPGPSAQPSAANAHTSLILGLAGSRLAPGTSTARPNSRATQRRTRPLGPSTLGLASPPLSSQTQGGARMLHATSPPPARNRTLTGPLTTLRQAREGEGDEGHIDEESALDGEQFVVPTKGRPFGREDGDQVEEDAGARGGVGAEVGRGGVGGLLGELYDVSGRKW